MTKTELADLYGISRPTFNTRIAGMGFEKNRKKFTAKEVEQIMNYLGPPPKNKSVLNAHHEKATLAYHETFDEKQQEMLEELVLLFEQLPYDDQPLLLKLVRTWCAFRDKQG